MLPPSSKKKITDMASGTTLSSAIFKANCLLATLEYNKYGTKIA